MVMGQSLNGLKSPQARSDISIHCFYRGKDETLKFFNLSPRAPSRGGVTGGVSPCHISYVVLNILNYLELYIRDQGVSLSLAPLGNSPDLEQSVRHPGGRRASPRFTPLFPTMVPSDSATFGPAALPPLHVHSWRTT